MQLKIKEKKSKNRVKKQILNTDQKIKINQQFVFKRFFS